MSDARLEKLQEKEARIKAQIKQEKARLKEKERKARNHRLIEIGAMLESSLGRPVEKEEIPLLNNWLRSQSSWIEKALAKKPPTTDATEELRRELFSEDRRASTHDLLGLND